MSFVTDNIEFGPQVHSRFNNGEWPLESCHRNQSKSLSYSLFSGLGK